MYKERGKESSQNENETGSVLRFTIINIIFSDNRLRTIRKPRYSQATKNSPRTSRSYLKRRHVVGIAIILVAYYL
jgi:hypothetical protein